ncbi:MAG TPA: hypothetical protein VGQ93_08105 [Lysobacter sp.]|jgi:hypothetical protein|nr:hypothetical protein [Lysobacter sp.]
MPRAIGVLVLLIALLFSPSTFAGGRTLRVLFVGNSLTYYNDLPRTFATLYRATEPGTAVQTEMLATGGGALRERISEGQLAMLLSSQHYDLVVLQELGGWPLCATGDARCEDSPLALREAVNLVRANGARALWFSTWQKLPKAQQQLSISARQVASGVNVEMIDVGAAMQRVAPAARKQLLLKDGHPDIAGTWLVAAALVDAASENPLPKTAPPQSCGSNWRNIRLTATKPASVQSRGEAKCHALNAAQWRAVRNAVIN